MKTCVPGIATVLVVLALASCSPARSSVAPGTPAADVVGGALPAAGGSPSAAVPLPSTPKRLKLGTLGGDEWVDPQECAFAAGVSAEAVSYVMWIRKQAGAGRLLTSTGEITGVDELLVLYKDSPVPAGRYRQGDDEYVFVGNHQDGPYSVISYYETWDSSIQAARQGSRWAYWYLARNDFYLASSFGTDFGPYQNRPYFVMRDAFFLAQLPDDSWSLDGKPLAAKEVSTAGDILAYVVSRADGEYLVVHGVTEKGPFQSVENVTVTEQGWAAVGREADGTARLLTDSGNASAVPGGDVDQLIRGNGGSWSVALRRGDSIVLWSPESGESEPVVGRTCTFYTDAAGDRTIARYRVGDEHHYFVRELGSSFGPYMYCKTNDYVPSPVVTANGWVIPPVLFEKQVVMVYRYHDKVTFIPTSMCEDYPQVVDNGTDVAFVVDTNEQASWVCWKGRQMGPYRDVTQLAIHAGNLLYAAHDRDGTTLLCRNGETVLSFSEDGVLRISRNGSSSLFTQNGQDSTTVYVNGNQVAEGLILTAGETVADGEPQWYWLSQEGNDLFLTLYRFR